MIVRIFRNNINCVVVVAKISVNANIGTCSLITMACKATRLHKQQTENVLKKLNEHSLKVACA